MWLMTENKPLGPICIQQILQNRLQCLKSFLHGISHVLNPIHFLPEQF